MRKEAANTRTRKKLIGDINGGGLNNPEEADDKYGYLADDKNVEVKEHEQIGGNTAKEADPAQNEARSKIEPHRGKKHEGYAQKPGEDTPMRKMSRQRK